MVRLIADLLHWLFSRESEVPRLQIRRTIMPKQPTFGPDSLLKYTLMRTLPVLLGALLLLFPAFNNGYPFLYADTSTYITGGFLGAVSDYRPITYGLFVRHISLLESLWLVAFVQALIVSALIHLVFRAFSASEPGIRPLVTIAALTLTTHIGISTGMLMPDFLTPAAVLSTGILFFAERLRRAEAVFCGFVLWLGLSAHFSNHYIFLVILLGVGGYWAWQRWRARSAFRPRRFWWVVGLWILAYFTIPTLHYIHGGGFVRDKAAHVFLVGRLNQAGLLKPFLREQCGRSGNWGLCAYKDAIPDDFLWNSESPVYKTGGWAANKDDYNRFLSAFFTTPRYLSKFCFKTVETALTQFFTFEGRIIFKEREGNPPFDAIRDAMPDQLPAIRNSKQYTEQWDNHVLDIFQRFAVLLSFLVFAAVLTRPTRVHSTPALRHLAALLLLALLANALVCSGVSMVDMRFQARVIWLAPLLATLFFWEWSDTRRSAHSD